MAGSSSSSAACAVLLASLVCAACLFGSGEASGAAHRVVDPEWHPATATWYGSAEGDGSDGKTSYAQFSHPSFWQRISNGDCIYCTFTAPKLVILFFLL
jgi:hypothetical protein